MTRTIYYSASSLDGFIATEDDSLDWLFALGDSGLTNYPSFIAAVGALAMGSTTYEWMLQHGLKLGTDDETPWPYTQPVWVFTTRTLPTLPGVPLHFVSGDVRPVHDAMREAAQGKNVWIVGGGALVGQFHDAGLLDEVIVQVGSATLGAGKPLLPRRISGDRRLHLMSVERLGPEFAELRYEVR